MAWTCVNCREPIPAPTSDPFRCPDCRRQPEPTDDAGVIAAASLRRAEDFRDLLDLVDRRGLDTLHSWIRGLATIEGRTVCR